jgi:hypothetical protein
VVVTSGIKSNMALSGLMRPNKAARILFLAVVVLVAFVAGAAWERVRFEDAQLYWLGRYSAHLHELVDQKSLGQLTNDIVAFDVGIRPKLGQSSALQDGMYRILKLGAYYQLTNQTTDTPQR